MWNNKEIKANNKPVFYKKKKLFQQDIFVNDLLLELDTTKWILVKLSIVCTLGCVPCRCTVNVTEKCAILYISKFPLTIQLVMF